MTLGRAGDESGPSPSRPSQIDRLAGAVAWVCAVVVAIVYGADAWALTRYRWDWSPDEGLYLDFARRLLTHPGTLYGHTLIPWPNPYTPLFPVVLAPLVAWTANPLAAARVLAFGFTLAAAVAVYALVRQVGPRMLALASAALFLAPLDLSFWHMLARMDGPMLAFWLLALLPLLPKSLARGGDQLSWSRVWLGSVLLMTSVLFKQLAVLHGAPLVLGWFLVDFRSARRLTLAMGALGLGTLLVLQVATSGAFLWSMGMWGVHPSQPGLWPYVLKVFAVLAWPVLALCAAGILAALLKGAAPFRDGALLAVLGGFAAIPTLRFFGAWWNYLLPGFAATIIWGARCWSLAGARAERKTFLAWVTLAFACVGLLLVATRRFPLPTRADAATATFFYDVVQRQVAATHKPILAVTPEYAYYLVGQPVEVEGSAFRFKAEARVAGSEQVLAKIAGGAYALVIEAPTRMPEGAFRAALVQNYHPVLACRLPFFYGQFLYLVHFPVASDPTFRPPQEARCAPFSELDALVHRP